MTHQPLNQHTFIFLFEQLPDDFVLQAFGQLIPCLAEIFITTQNRTGGVALEFLAFHILKIKLSRATQIQQLFDLSKSAFAVMLQRMNQLIALW